MSWDNAKKLALETIIYWAAILMACITFYAAATMQVSELLKAIIAIPGSTALCAAVYQLFRDTQQFRRQKELHLDRQVFEIGASAHMSTVAFDKLVAFCEAYMQQIHEIVGSLLRNGSTKQAFAYHGKLLKLQQEYAAWVPESISDQLRPFENAIHEMGIQEHLIESYKVGGEHEIRSEAIKQSTALLQSIMDVGSNSRTRELAAGNFKRCIREALDIEDLFEIRRFIISRSAHFARKMG